MSNVHHAINYIEITVSDVAQAKAFYGSAFGWTFSDYGPNYAGIKGEGSEQGGLMKGEPKWIDGAPLVVLYSKSLDESVKSVREAGGKIVKDPFEFPGGRRFQFTDPSGNQLAVWSEK